MAEGLEFLRDRRSGPRDLSEEFMWWYSKEGHKITGGGYDCRAALSHYGSYGSCDETFLPYSPMQIGSNHAHIPVPDEAIDSARNYRQPPLANLPARDVEALKQVLRSGRCAAVLSGTSGWRTGAGIVEFPDPLDSMGIGASHCTAAIGFIDRDDLPEHYEGGYFIIRNSWGGAGSSSHSMGPEYGGHLLMPYGWYRRYTWGAATLGQLEEPVGSEASRTWRAEYFKNRTLRGTPAVVKDVQDVDFDWGSAGPFRTTIAFPFLGEIELPALPTDDFSARFTQIRRLRSGWYRFTLRGDDGLRLWIDDRLVINGWRNQAATTYSAEHYVTGGDHVLRVEYYEAGGVASVDLDVEAVHFDFELFTNTELSGAAAATFQDTMTDLEWRHAPPVTVRGGDGTFSLRATGSKHFEAGRYRFHAWHTGGCRIWLDDELVLDDWDSAEATGRPVDIREGNHDVRVEFRNLETLPAEDEKRYYRAALAFDWSEEGWRGRIHEDLGRRDIFEAAWPNTDSHYEAYRTLALTGVPQVETWYSTQKPEGATYGISDRPTRFRLSFPDLGALAKGFPGEAAFPDGGHFVSAQINRRLFISEAGRYTVELRADEAFRVMVDDVQVLQQRRGGNDPFQAEVDLPVGVHEVSIEYANTRWGGKVGFLLEKADWRVTYFDGTDLETPVADRTLSRADDLVEARPDSLTPSSWSARAKHTMWLPVGRYRVAVKADDGVRVKTGGLPLVDAWTDQDSTVHVAHFEHKGGAVPVELEYYQRWGSSSIAFDISPDGYLAEYYRGVHLENPPDEEDWERNIPVAYRFEPVVNFDWGATGRLARVGSDRFSARFWGNVDLPVGRWAFKLTSDDGVRLFLDDRLLIDNWKEQSATERVAVVDLPAGRREVRLEYFEKTGKAVCRLLVERVY